MGGFCCTYLRNRLLFLQTPIKTSKRYFAIAAVTAQNLAVGYSIGAGIDLIDLSGNILYKMSKDFHLYNLFLICSHLSLSCFQSVKISIVSQGFFQCPHVFFCLIKLGTHLVVSRRFLYRSIFFFNISVYLKNILFNGLVMLKN